MNHIPLQHLQDEIISLKPLLEKFIFKYGSDSREREDLVQDVLIKAFLKAETLTPPYHIQGWLLTLARNYCLNYIAREQKRRTFEKILSEEIEFNTYCQDNASVCERQRLTSIIGGLPHNLRSVVIMKYYSRHKIEEISQIMKIPPGTVKRRLYDSRKLLQKEMEMIQNSNLEKETKTPKTPEIIVTPLKNSKKIMYKRTGSGLCSGAPLKELGDVEVCDVFQYPGRIFQYRAYSKVTRKSEVLGKEVWEVRNDYIQREGEEVRYLYFSCTDKQISMPFRVFNFLDEGLQIDIEQEELPEPEELYLSTGVFDNKECDLVDIEIESRKYKKVIRKRSCENGYHGDSYSESFIEEGGRTILDRLWIGKNWKMGGHVEWEKWKDAPEIEFKNKKYRLFTEFVLTDAYKEEV